MKKPQPQLVRIPLSDECVELVVNWVGAHFPCTLSDPKGEFIAGVFVIIEDEVKRAVDSERARVRAIVTSASVQ